MFDKMKQMMEFKKQAERIKKELDETVLETNMNGIKVVVNGAQQIRSIAIAPGSLTSDNKAKLESDLLVSINAALKQSQDTAARKMSSVMPGIGNF